MTGVDVSGCVIVLDELEADLQAGGVPTPNGLTIAGPPISSPVAPPPAPPAPPAPCPPGSVLFTYDDQGNPADLPPEALPIVEAYTVKSPGSAAHPTVAHIHIEAASDLEQLKAAVLEAIP